MKKGGVPVTNTPRRTHFYISRGSFPCTRTVWIQRVCVVWGKLFRKFPIQFTHKILNDLIGVPEKDNLNNGKNAWEDPWRLWKSLTSGLICLMGVLLIKIYCTPWVCFVKCESPHSPVAPNGGDVLYGSEKIDSLVIEWNLLNMSETGDTLSEVPITRSRSTRGWSSANAVSYSLESFSPKKVISG